MVLAIEFQLQKNYPNGCKIKRVNQQLTKVGFFKKGYSYL